MHLRCRSARASACNAAALAIVTALSASWATPAAAKEEDLFTLDLHAKVHFTSDAAIASATYVVASAHLPARGYALLVAGGTAMAAGFGKELLDLHTEGRFGWREIAWDAFGTAAGLGLAWGLDLLIRGKDAQHPLLFAPAADGRGTALFRF